MPDEPIRLHLRDLANPAGALTLARLPLAALFPFVVDEPVVALAVYAVAMFTDVVDGEVARRTGTASQTGSLLDGFLDKVFHVNAAWAMALADVIPAWWMLCWFSRELLQLTMVPWLWTPFFLGRVRPHRASRAGKALAVSLAVTFAATLTAPLWSPAGHLAAGLTPAIGVVGAAVGVAYIRRSLRLRRAAAGS